MSADPLTDVVAGVLEVPLRHLYGLLWRWGLIDIAGDRPASFDADDGPSRHEPQGPHEPHELKSTASRR